MVDSAPSAESYSLVLRRVCGSAGDSLALIIDLGVAPLSFLGWRYYFSLSTYTSFPQLEEETFLVFNMRLFDN